VTYNKERLKHMDKEEAILHLRFEHMFLHYGGYCNQNLRVSLKALDMLDNGHLADIKIVYLDKERTSRVARATLKCNSGMTSWATSCYSSTPFPAGSTGCQ
jgi:hypothetical protein